RQFDYTLDRIARGETPITLDSAKLTKVRNDAFAKQLANNKLTDRLEQLGLLKHIDTNLPFEKAKNYVELGNTGKYIEKDMERGLKAIIERDIKPDIPALKTLSSLQGLTKAVDLSMSFFHHRAMLFQALYDTRGSFGKV